MNCGISVQWNATKKQKERATDTWDYMDELKNIMLSEKQLASKSTYYLILFI